MYNSLLNCAFKFAARMEK